MGIKSRCVWLNKQAPALNPLYEDCTLQLIWWYNYVNKTFATSAFELDADLLILKM